jgi:hypothetical protein
MQAESACYLVQVKTTVTVLRKEEAGFRQRTPPVKGTILDQLAGGYNLTEEKRQSNKKK